MDAIYLDCIMIVEKICKWCGKTFQIVERGLERGKFCSKPCAWAWRSKNLRGENAPAWKGGIEGRGKTKQICLQCGIEFTTESAWIRRRKNHFCSTKCHDVWRSVNKRGNNHHLWIPRGKYTCVECGCEFERLPKKGEKCKFCSSKCFHVWRVKNIPLRGENSPMWNGGLSYGKYCPDFRPVRPRVRAWYEYRCMFPNCECGNDIVAIGVKPQLDVHHVYYQKEACCYHTEEGEFVFDLGKDGKITVQGNPTKFVTLCRSANGKVNKNRLYWAKYFENLINTKYDGKSYYTKEEFHHFISG